MKGFFHDMLFVQIDSYVCGSLCSDVPFLLVAGAGTGKSSVLAKAADVACTKALYGTIPKSGFMFFYLLKRQCHLDTIVLHKLLLPTPVRSTL